MRIVGGEHGGRRIVAPRGRGVRPTRDRVREAIFDVLHDRVRGARVLDLFAGSGALGLEALSRGAAHATFCDAAARPVQAIRDNARRLGFPPPAVRVLLMPALQAIRRLAGERAHFDVVFVDPPYESLLYDETLLALAIEGLVAPGGVVVVEHGRRRDIGAVYGDLHGVRRRRYGETCVTTFERRAGGRAREEGR